MQRYSIALDYLNTASNKRSYGGVWMVTEADKEAAIALKDAEIERYKSIVARVVEAMDGPNEGFTYQLYLDCKAILKEGE